MLFPVLLKLLVPRTRCIFVTMTCSLQTRTISNVHTTHTFSTESSSPKTFQSHLSTLINDSKTPQELLSIITNSSQTLSLSSHTHTKERDSIYTTALRKCSHKRMNSPSTATTIIHTHPSPSLQLITTYFNTLSTSDELRPPIIKYWLDYIQKTGRFQPDRELLNCIIQSFIKRKRVELSDQIFHLFTGFWKIEPSLETYMAHILSQPWPKVARGALFNRAVSFGHARRFAFFLRIERPTPFFNAKEYVPYFDDICLYRL